MKRILAATDGSDGANRAVEAAARLAAALRAELWIVNVMDGISGEELNRISHVEKSSVGDVLDAISDRILVTAKERSQSLGVPTIHLKSRSGDSAQAILETARDINADAIFAGKRGRGRLAGVLLGSVSQKLASLAPCMVVIVP
jgi:nucleotide-binding universal stress UspA family protein